MVPRSVTVLIAIHGGISLPALAAHMILHPLQESLFFWWASPFSFFSLPVIPILYGRVATVAWGVLFDGMTVVIGTIGMAYCFLLTFEGLLALLGGISKFILPKIILFWTKLSLFYFIFCKVSPLKVDLLGYGCLE